jgi:glycosyltransferase involved in cell wall biosynthesis
MNNKPLVVACIPAYNEEGRMASVIVRARRRVGAVVVCDDGSGDLTGAIAEGLGAVVIRHGRN